MSSVSSVSSASSSSSSVRSADSEDMYADLASPVSSASSRSPTPAQQKKGRGTWFGFFIFTGVLGKGREQRSACSLLDDTAGAGKISQQGTSVWQSQVRPWQREAVGQTHVHPFVHVAVKMPFPAQESCLMLLYFCSLCKVMVIDTLYINKKLDDSSIRL